MKENIIEKIVKRDYNEELEKIFEIKSFSEDVKSILLSILYKIEAGYEDIKNVKKDIETKEEYIEKYIQDIYDNVVKIKLVNMNDKESNILEGKTFYINKEKKEIEVYPIERKVLYAINKISRKEEIINEKYYLINEVIKDLLNVGNIIQKVEPLRDFNGYSWTTVEREIESINHNLIYQILRMLVGNKFLESFVEQKEKMIDYYEEFVGILEEKYGEEIAKKIVRELIKIGVLFEKIYDKEKLEKYNKENLEVKKEIKKMSNMAKYLEEVKKKKIEITEKIRKIDEILNDKKKMQEEYIRRNENLELDKKIFSMRILGNMLIEDKENLYDELEELNNLTNPKNFLMYKEKVMKKNEILSLLDIENINEELEKSIEKMQEYYLKCFEIKIESSKTKEEIIKLIYEYRYYNLIPKNKKIDSKNILMKLIEKGIELKVIVEISKNKEINYNILEKIFETRIIKLENIEIKVVKENENLFIQIFDEKMFEEKIKVLEGIKIKKEDLLIKINKKTKVFLVGG